MDTHMVDFTDLSQDYQRIEQAIQFLETNYQRQPELEEVAQSIGLSEYHFQRLFTRWVGISPKRFLQFLTKESAKRLLAQRANVLDAAYESGLSGPGRLHDLFVTCEAVTPGEYKSLGEGLKISYGFHPSPFGEILLAMTDRGICNLIFVQDGRRAESLAVLRAHWRLASLVEDAELTRPVVQQAFAAFGGGSPAPLHLHLRGTNFQIKVWEALLQIPSGSVSTYDEIAARIGQPGASRAVGAALGKNPVAVLIPCHRVIRKAGEFGGYQWGAARKKALLAWEHTVQERKS
jgi:AraC family transcriptional regulator of adaptative response/methylated-DNA-[protein]-cysteine methyltransferase